MLSTRRRIIISVVLTATLFIALTTMIQPSYFLANPSLYSLFSAVVADRGVAVERGLSYGAHARQKLDIYRPSAARDDQRTPVVLFLYGGTWKEGDRAIYGFLGAALASRGITTVIPDYRLHPDVQFPTFVEDAARAYSWTDNTFGSGGRDIIVMGHSAGAHMAALIALNPAYIHAVNARTRPPGGLIGLAGPYAFDLTTYPTTQDLFRPDQDPTATIPASFVTRNAPPALLIHGGSDDTVKRANQEVLAEKLEAAGVPVTTFVPDGITHVGLVRSLAWPFRMHSPVIDHIVHFVRKQHARPD